MEKQVVRELLDKNPYSLFTMNLKSMNLDFDYEEEIILQDYWAFKIKNESFLFVKNWQIACSLVFLIILYILL